MIGLSFYDIPIPFSLSVLRKLTPVNPLIVNYHVVSDKRLSHIEYLYNFRTITGFKEDIEFFCKYYIPIGMHDLLNHIKNNAKLPENSFIITFDDGFREVYDIVLPILLEYNISATAFLTTNFIDNKELGYPNKKSLLISEINKLKDSALNVKLISFLEKNNISGTSVKQAILRIPYVKRYLLDEIAQLINVDFIEFLQENKPYLTSLQVNELIKEGITIGSHSIDHARFSELSTDDQIFQAIESTRLIQKFFDINYKIFAFPFTDIHISKLFYEKTKDEFDITFGTQGMLRDSISNNIQRVNIEKFKQPALKTLKSNYVRKIIYGMIGKHIIIRNNTS